MWLETLANKLLSKANANRNFKISQENVTTIVKHADGMEKKMENFLATGNITKSKTGLGLMQDKGLVIIAENLNRMRYISHFKSVHRGAFFTVSF